MADYNFSPQICNRTDFLVHWSSEDGSTVIYIEMVPSIWGIHIF